MTDITISIVAYDNEADVRRAVTSIEEHTDPKLRKTIYVIDNGRELNDLQELTAQYEDVRYYRMVKNLGFGGGHNYVIPMLDAPYHAIVNPDIVLTEDSLSILCDFMKRTNAGMAVPRLVGTDGKLQAAYRRQPTVLDMGIRMFFPNHFKRRQRYHTLQEMDYSKPFRVPFAQGSFLVVKTKAFEWLEGFDPRYFMYMEDADLSRGINLITEGVWYCPDTTVIHRWERGSHKDPQLLKYHFQSMFRFFRRWRWQWW